MKPVADLRALARALPPAVFVTATDTDAGKTVVSRAIVAAWRAAGHRVCAVKAVSTGCAPTRRGWTGGDAPLLREAAGADADELLRACGVVPGEAIASFRAPMGPAGAARLEGRRVPVARIERTVRALAAACEREGFRFLVEGAGGPMVPLEKGTFVADLIARVEMPAVLVARTTLGTINHTLLAAECLRARGIVLAAVVASRARGGPMDAVERDGVREIAAALKGVRVAVLDFIPQNPAAKRGGRPGRTG